MMFSQGIEGNELDKKNQWKWDTFVLFVASSVVVLTRLGNVEKVGQCKREVFLGMDKSSQLSVGHVGVRISGETAKTGNLKKVNTSSRRSL